LPAEEEHDERTKRRHQRLARIFDEAFETLWVLHQAELGQDCGTFRIFLAVLQADCAPNTMMSVVNGMLVMLFALVWASTARQLSEQS
jgi:hypothetical protein